MAKLGEQLLLCFLGFMLRSSAGEEDQTTLNGRVGGVITFPAPVMLLGFLAYNANTISMVSQGKNNILENRFSDKVLWNNQTGQFSVINLLREDTGVYKVEAKMKEGTVFRYYQLHVYEPVPAPTVNVSAVSRESCSLVCLLEKTGGESSMLSWYRKDKLLNQTSRLSLPLVVDTEHHTSSYSCVSSNPVDNKTVLVNIATTCSSGSYKDNKLDVGDDKRKFVIPLVVGLFALFLTMVIMVMVRRKRRGRDKESQGSGVSELSAIVYSTFYSKQRFHRMTPTETFTEAVFEKQNMRGRETER